MLRELQRLNMNMPVNLIQQVDKYANRMNLNRTSAMICLVSTALEQSNAIDIMGELLDKLSVLEESMSECQKEKFR
jgi:hypothetical protein